MIDKSTFKAKKEDLKSLGDNGMHFSIDLQKLKDSKNSSKRILTCVLSCVQLFETPWDCSPPLSWDSQAKILEWVAISFSRGSSQTRVEPKSSVLAGRFFTTESAGKPLKGSFLHANKNL